MTLLTVEEVIELQEKLIKRTGGSYGLRDRGLLESAVLSTQSSFGNHEHFPTVQEKAARLMYALVSNHAFVDGNKRIGVFAMLIILKLNGIAIKYTQPELIALGLSTASSQIEYNDILEWIYVHQV